MKLSNETVSLLLEATNLSCILGIEGLIADNEAIRGYNEDDAVMIIAHGPFSFEFDKLGLSRLVSLKQKFKLLNDAETIEVEAIPRKTSEELIEKLKFDCGNIDFEFRCALPRSIKDVPSLKFKIEPLFSFNINSEDYKTMVKSSSAMRSKNMTIQGKDDNVQFRFSDDTGDILNCKVESELEVSGDEDDLTLTLNLKKMLPIFKLALESDQEENFKLNILKNNIVHVSVNDMDVLVMPEV